MKLWRVERGGVVAGYVTSRSVVVRYAPILRRYVVNATARDAKRCLESWNWKVEEVKCSVLKK